MIAEISLLENALFIVKDGRVTKLTPKQHGEDTIIWKEGKVLDVIRSERVRLGSKEVI
jgi:hypothetical protein